MRRWLSEVLLLAGVCLLTGWLALVTARPPAATAVWPPVGIALVGLLVFGNRVWPAVWLAHVILFIPEVSKYDPDIGWLQAIPGVVLLASAFALQAAFGAWLVRRTIGYPTGLIRSRDVMTFLLIVGPLHTVLAATLCVSVLCAYGIREWAEFPSTWMAWWLSDTVGGVLFAPLVMTVLARPIEVWKPRRLTMALPILAATGVTAAGFLAARQLDFEAPQRQLRTETRHAADVLKDEFHRVLDGMEVVRQAYEGGANVRTKVGRAIVRDDLRLLRRTCPMVRTASIGELVVDEQRNRFEQDTRRVAARLDQFRVIELGDDDRLVPAARRNRYLVIAHVDPPDDAAALGFDLLSDPTRRDSFERALETGKPTATGPVRLPQLPGDQDCFVVLVPFYESAQPSDPASRRRMARGVLEVVIEGSDLTQTLTTGRESGVRFTLTHASNSPAAASPLGHATRIELAGQDWELRAFADTAFVARHQTRYARLTGAVGVLLTGLLTALLLTVTGRAAAISDEVAARTTELSQEVVARRATEARLADAQRIARVGSFEWTPGANEAWWSSEMYRLLGYEPGEVRPTLAALLDRVHPDDRDSLRKRMQAALDRDEPYTFEFRIELPSGEERVLSVDAVITRDAAGRPVLFRGMNQDVTERRRTEEAVRTTAMRLAEAQRIARLAFWEWDPGTGATWWSDLMFATFGVDPTGFKPSYEGVIALIHPDDRARVEEVVRRVTHHGGHAELEYRSLLPNGEIRWLRGDVVRPTASAGPLRGTVQDITERVRAEMDRRKFEENLQQTQKLESLGILAGGVAHDFNNLLTGILGNASLVRESVAPDSPLHEHLRPIEKSAEQAAHLCQQMLTYTGKSTAVRGLVDLNSLMDESADLLRLSVPRKATLRFDWGSPLPLVLGDAGQLRQVLLNLVQNAAEALDASGGEVAVRTGCDSDRVWLEVTDTGCGMDEITRARVFEPFFTTKFTGRGLGLSAMHGIITRHGGTIAVTSEPKRGTTFRITLPAAPRPVSPAAPVHVNGTADTPLLTGRTALVADDEPAVRGLAAIALRSLGFSVTEAATGRQALDYLRADPSRFAIVLLDLVMPDLDGRETLAELRKLRPELPVVLISGYTEHDLADLPFGPTLHFLQKPFRPSDLTNSVRRAVAAKA